MTINTATRAKPETLIAVQVDTADAADIVAISAALVTAGSPATIHTDCEAQFPSLWRLTANNGDGTNHYAGPGDWLLISDASVTYTNGAITALNVAATSRITVFSALYPEVYSVANFTASYTTS